MSGGYIQARGRTDSCETIFTAEERQLASEQFTPLGAGHGSCGESALGDPCLPIAFPIRSTSGGLQRSLTAHRPNRL
jgi:hypothetical protein